MKKIALIVAHEGYQQDEYNIPKDIFMQHNFHVITVSDEPGTATAKDNSTTTIDLVLEEVNPLEIDGAFIIGGPGALDCLDNSILHNLMREFSDLYKPFGAICISPRILARAGLLKNRRATGWNGDNKLEDHFFNYEVQYVREAIVIDDNIVTAEGPHISELFSLAILEKMNRV